MTYGSVTTDATNGDDFDPISILFTPDAANDPHPVYAQLRDTCPVAAAPAMAGEARGWVASRYEDVMWALRHPEIFSSAPEAVSIGQAHKLIPLQVDPPEHAKYRRWLDSEFAPKRMADLEPDVRVLVRELVDELADKGECDFHEDFATPLPSTIFLRLMGWPQSDLAIFLQWRDNTIRPSGATWEENQEIRDRTGAEINQYFIDKIAEKRANPDDALCSRLVHSEIEGRPATDEELLGTLHLFLIAGLDTVTATLDCMMAYLAQHPDRRRMLVERPELIDAAVEELLRTETPVQMVARAVHQDCELGGVQMKAGDSFAPLLGAANTDEREFDAAGEVDFERDVNRHLAFGAGPHRCLGSNLARMELRVGIEEFLARIPEPNIRDGFDLEFSPGIRQANTGLPLVWKV